MFGFIPFIESFFLLSLGITFILIFLMVFHFKQRIEKLEKKNNNLSDLSNKIVKEITNLHSIYLQNQQQQQQPPRHFVNPKEHICENIRITTSMPISVDNNNCNYNDINENNYAGAEPYKKIVVMDTIINDDIMTIESDSEYDEEENDESDFEETGSESESVFNLEEVNEFSVQDTKEEIHLIKYVDKDEIELDRIQKRLDEILVELDENDKKLETITEPTPVETMPDIMDYRKMNISKLRILAISKGLCSDTSKIKRADLIKLLESESEI